ncbi:MAG: hypothetical protein RSA10_01960, partial [Bacilli bacterium]
LANQICSGGMLTIVAIIGLVLRVIQWVVPIILILLGTIDLVKAVTQGKDEDIKKSQKTLISRAIAAVVVFLIPLIVSTIMGLLGTNDWKKCWVEHHNDPIGNITEVSF